MGLKDLVKAEKYLTTLASMDYTYRDTSDILERLHHMLEEDKGKPPEGQEDKEGDEGENPEGRKKKDEDDEESAGK